MCSKRGQRRNDGSCKCSVGFIGEACGSRAICCSDRARCYDAVCDLDPRRLIVVAGELGDDALGTGVMMDASESGTTSKAVASLSKAISMSSSGDTIFVYPGEYKGLANRNLAMLAKKDITIRSMRGSNWTKIDCERQGQAFDIASSTATFEGLAILNCVAAEGAGLRIASSAVKLVDVVITSAFAMQRGGAVYATDATLVVTQSVITKCSASNGAGGGIFLVGSALTLNRSSISSCSAASGGAIALSAAASVLGIEANLTGNTASSEGGAVSAQGDATITGVAISTNTAGVMGGAILLRNGTYRITNVTVTRNSAGARGGGVAIVGQVDASIIESLILENRASVAGGGILFQGMGLLAFADTTGTVYPASWL